MQKQRVFVKFVGRYGEMSAPTNMEIPRVAEQMSVMTVRDETGILIESVP